jgi:hypothetical protein
LRVDTATGFNGNNAIIYRQHMKKTLISFHGKQEIKDAKIADIKKHRELDNLKQGTYWNGQKGCAVTCTMFTPEDFLKKNVDESNIHGRYETVLGIPRIIARLEDRIFEGLPVLESKDWPLNFIEAIPVGVDLTNVWRKLMIWLLTDDAEGVVKYAKNENGRQAIRNVAQLFEKSLTQEVTWSEWDIVRKAARSYAAAAAAAAAAAYAAAADAADAAAYAAYAAYAAAAAAAAAYAAAADAADAAAYAAYADADAAAAAAADADAAAAAADAADAAAYAAAAAAAAAAADAADAAARTSARRQHFIKISNKLIELLKEAK